MDGVSTQEVLVEESVDIMEALAFDWVSKNLYWVESGHTNKGIWAVAVWGSFEQRYRALVINSSHVDQPRALVLDPQGG